METDPREIHAQIQELHLFSHLIFYQQQNGIQDCLGESLQGRLSQMIGWPSAYMHWEGSGCLLDCRWLTAYLGRRGDLESPLKHSERFRHASSPQDWNSGPDFDLHCISVWAQQIWDVPRLYQKSERKGERSYTTYYKFRTIFVLGTR